MKRWAGYGSIRNRMMVWLLVVTGLILAAVIFWSYLDSRRRLEADMEAKAVFLAEGAARRIDAQLGLLQGVVHGMALTLETQQLAIPFEGVRAMQGRCLQDYEGIYGVCVALEPELAPADWPDLAAWEYRLDGRPAYEDLSGPDHAHTREDWFTLPKYLERPVWSEPYQWEGVLMVTYSVPIYIPVAGERRFAGVVTCDLTLDWLEHMIGELPLGPGGYGLLMSRNGTYVSHPLPELVLNETVFSIAEARGDPQLRALGQRMVSGRSGIEPFVSFVTGDLSWLAFTPLQSTDWIMVAMISREEMKEAILQLSHRQAVIGLGGLLLLGLAIHLIAGSITRPIRDLRDAAGTLAAGQLDAPLPAPRGQDEVAHLTRAFADMRGHLKQYLADLRKTTAARERMHSELRIAHDIQMGLVPKTFPPFPDREDLDLYAVLEPAREVGGDFYDFLLLDENRLAVAIGDVSGKGVPAALFMAVTRSFLRSAFRANSEPAEVLDRVNHELAEGNDSCMFVTLFCGVVDLANGRMQYANAGHNSPALCHPDGRLEWIAEPRGPIAGVIPEASYTTGSVHLPREATLILYTDGVTEAMNVAGELYGEDRLGARLGMADRSADCRTWIERLVADIRTFATGAEPSDDITILTLKRPSLPSNASCGGAPGMDTLLRLSIANDLRDLERAVQDIDRFLAPHGVSAKLGQVIRLAIEEVVTNIIKYGYDDEERHRCEVILALGAPPTMTVEDDGRPFNPLTDAPAPVLEGPVEERAIGGLGLHLLRSLGLRLHYQRENGRNKLQIEFPNQ